MHQIPKLMTKHYMHLKISLGKLKVLLFLMTEALCPCVQAVHLRQRPWHLFTLIQKVLPMENLVYKQVLIAMVVCMHCTRTQENPIRKA